MPDLSTRHARLAHINADSIKDMARNKVVEGYYVDLSHHLITCDSCILENPSVVRFLSKREPAR